MTVHCTVAVLTACAFVASAAFPTSAVAALTLDDYYAAALRRSEVVANQVELIRQAEERYRQAAAARLPRLEGQAAYTRQESVPRRTLDGTSLTSRESLVRLNATQPVFRGFREFAALRQTQALIGAQNEDYQQARVALFQDVVQNFFDLLALQQESVNLAEEIEQNLKREQEIRGRVRIGRSRASEILTVQSAISTLRAEVEQLQGRLRVAREAFAFLSGLDPSTELRDTEVVPPRLAPVSEYLQRLDQRPDIKANRARLTAAQEGIEIARGARLPSVDLSGNYYLDRDGALRDVDWDVGLALSVPLYTGGAIDAQVREAASQRTQAELALSQARRLAEQEIRAAYQSVLYDQAQIDARERATEAARKNYEAQTRDYRLGLVTNLDVLQALTALQQNQRALDRARYTAKLDYLRLQAAAMQRPLAEEGVAP